MITLSIILILLLIGAIVATFLGAGVIIVAADIAVAIGVFVLILKALL